MECTLNSSLTLKFCNSKNNTLFVDDYKEVFFEIYEIKIGSDSFVAELINLSETGPIVRVASITLNNKYYKDVEFLLLKEQSEVRIHLNENDVLSKPSTEKPLTVTYLPEDKINTLIIENSNNEDVKVDVSSQLLIQQLKEQALLDIQKEKESLIVVKEDIEETNKKIEIYYEA